MDEYEQLAYESPWGNCPKCHQEKPAGSLCQNSECPLSDRYNADKQIARRRMRENEHSRYLESLGTDKPR